MPVIGVKASEKAANQEKYYNKRTEMWGEMRDWLIDGASLLDDDEIEADLTAPGFQFRGQQYLLESKEKMAKRDLPSPDCFVAGTLVAVPGASGADWVPIESLQEGDRVLTPLGEARIVCCHESIAEVVRARFSNGAQLVGTGKHKVFSWVGGAVRMDALGPEHAMDTWGERGRWLRWSRSSTAARGSAFKRRAGTFSPGERIRRSDFFIDGSGRTPMGRFPRGIMSTIAMAIGATTVWRTSSLSTALSTSACTCSNASGIPSTGSGIACIFGMQCRRLEPGTPRPLVVPSIGASAISYGKVESPKSALARSAERSSAHGSQLERDSAVVPAWPRSTIAAITKRSAGAWSAIGRSWRTFTGRRSVVPVAVEPCTDGPKRVYNLTLDQDNAFYANGVLVFNCGDSLAHTFYLPWALARDLDPDEARSGAGRNWKTA